MLYITKLLYLSSYEYSMGKSRKITKIRIKCDGCGKEVETNKTSGKVQCGKRLPNGDVCGVRTEI